jgi:cell division protein FtsW
MGAAMNKQLGIFLLSVGALLLLGAVLMDSVTMRELDPRLLKSHLRLIGFGLVAAALIGLTDYRWWRRWHVPEMLMGLAVVLLVLTLVPGIGTCRNSARRWLWGFQPSEFAKLAWVVGLADYCARHLAQMGQRRVGFVQPGLLASLLVGLIFLEPDWGTAVLLACVTGSVLFLAGTHWCYLGAAGIIGLELLAHFLLRNPEKLNRILVFLDPQRYGNRDEGRQVWHSLVTIGNGGWLGSLFGNNTHLPVFVPEQDADFVMSLVGGDLGFCGASLVVLLFLSVVLAGVRLGWRVGDPFGRFFVLAFTVLIGTQALINIGVATSSLPNKGIPLPFVSHGGSSLLSMLMGVGLLVSIVRGAPLLPVAHAPAVVVPPPEGSAAGAEGGNDWGFRAWRGRLVATTLAVWHGLAPRPDNPFGRRPIRHSYQRGCHSTLPALRQR